MTDKKKKNTTKKSKDKTLVTFLLDKSGSMSMRKGPTIEAFNTYVSELKKGGAPVEFSLIQFDTVSIEKNWVNTDINEVTGLDNNNYKPHGGTPLIDAVAKTIKALERSISERSDKPKVILCIQTDGEENASTEFNWEQLNQMIKEKSELGWQFNFMGAGIDAYKQAHRMGVSVGATMSYSDDLAATRAAFTASACNTMDFASGATRNTLYSSLQKSAAGDKFDPELNKGKGKV